MEADHWRFQIEHKLKPLLIKKRQWITRMWHGTQVKLVIIDSKALSHATSHICINARSRVCEEIQVKWPVSGPTYLMDVVPRRLRRLCTTTKRAERAGV
jgi:hypothetical protein